MTLTTALAASSGGAPQPGPGSFLLPPVFTIGGWEVNKPELFLAIAAVIVFAFAYVTSRRAQVVPGRLQFAGELVYGTIRDSIARDNIGSHDYMKYTPFLFTVFLFVLVNNFYGVIPFIQFPSMSKFAFPVALALVTWLIYNIAGIARHGFFGYLKHQTVPAGAQGPILLALVPLEFLSNIIVRPFTLALRLFATMFAGHLLILLFSLGAWYLVNDYATAAVGIPAGVLSFILGIGVSFLDMLIMFLQAYVFTLLTAMYIGSAIADEH